METLIAIFFTHIQIVHYTARTFAKHAGQTRVDLQGNILLLRYILTSKDNIHHMAKRNMIEVITRLLHLTPDAVWLTILHMHLSLHILLVQHFTNLVCKETQSGLIAQLVSMNKRCYLLILMWATIAEAQVLQLNLNGI